MNDECLEVKLSLPSNSNKKDIKIVFHCNSLVVFVKGSEKVNLKIGSCGSIDMKNCDWTLDVDEDWSENVGDHIDKK